MNKEELKLLQEIEEDAIQALNECWGYECIEYDNGTFECDDCPIYQSYCALQKKAERLLK